MIVLGILTHQPLFPTNVLVTILACRFAVQITHQRGWVHSCPLCLWAAGFVWALPFMVLFEYGTLAILYAVMGIMVREKLDGTKHRLFCALTIITFIAYQCIQYDFTLAQSMFVALGTVAFSHLVLLRFTLAPVNAAFIGTPVMLLARYSLYYYVLHRAALQFADMVLHPEIQDAFRWVG